MAKIAHQDFRYERKFFISSIHRHRVNIIIKSHPAFFREIFHKRKVNNIYFDSFQFQNFLDNVEGSTERVKFRIRWYNDMFGEVLNPVLELKIKKGMLGRKESYSLVPFKMNPDFTVNKIKDVIQNSDIPDYIKEKVKYLYPRLLNQYTRVYFMSANKKFRIINLAKLQAIVNIFTIRR